MPGQRMGAKQWYCFSRKFARDTVQFEWGVEQLCLARCKGSIFMVHVDDLVYCGDAQFWEQTFWPTTLSKFNVSYSKLAGESSSISFLLRKMVQLSDGTLVVIVRVFEKMVGKARRFHVTLEFNRKH